MSLHAENTYVVRLGRFIPKSGEQPRVSLCQGFPRGCTMSDFISKFLIGRKQLKGFFFFFFFFLRMNVSTNGRRPENDRNCNLGHS